jgi:hypothetical protein
MCIYPLRLVKKDGNLLFNRACDANAYHRRGFLDCVNYTAFDKAGFTGFENFGTVFALTIYRLDA